MNRHLNYSDNDYRSAINYDGTSYYNYPMTIEKDGVKFILPFGTSDSLTHKIIGDHYFIVGENNGLDYISLFVICSDNTTDSAYLSGNDLEMYNTLNCEGEIQESIFDMNIEDQIKILSEYLNY